VSPQWPAAADELISRLLGGPRELTLAELADVAGLSPEVAQRYWQLVGLPVTNPEAREFTRDDADSLRRLMEAASAEGLDERTMATLIRSVGHSTERLSLWHFEALVDHMVRRYDVSDADARFKVLEEFSRISGALEEQLVHAWRRQVAALAGRISVEFGSDVSADGRLSPRDGGELPLPRAVGFADIVSFTRLTATLGATELANFIQVFEDRARDVVTANGGRVVKTIGDALLFIADDVATGAKVALGLAQAGQGTGLVGPDGVTARPVRVSLVWGRVLSRFGDVFGPSVNLASRLTDQADPSTVLLDPATARRLAGDARFALTELPPRDMPGVGEVAPVRLEWAEPDDALGDGPVGVDYTGED